MSGPERERGGGREREREREKEREERSGAVQTDYSPPFRIQGSEFNLES